MNNQSFIDKFQVPEAAHAFIHLLFTQEEIDFVTELQTAVFSVADIAAMGIEKPQEFARRCYQRGVISLVGEEDATYKLSDFYGRLDIFSISETETYRSLSQRDRAALDQWYFETYYEGLDKNPDVRPTQDEILPLEQVLEFIERQERPVYLNYCDCRSLGGDCGLPTRTCITYKNGINSFAHRGLSVHISKEQAKEIVIGADKAGLMHTVNPNGICNCCDDCCYLFRAQSRRNSAGFWPKTQHLVEIDGDKCVACGNCVETCRFHALHIAERIDADLSRCVGCGICVQACPAKALKLRKRNGNISEKR